MPNSAPEFTPRELLELMLGHLGFVFEVDETRSDEHLLLNIRTRDPGRLIGRDGRTLEDLHYLVNRLLTHAEPVEGSSPSHSRVVVDVEGYRQKLQEDFLSDIRVKAERVKKTGEAEKLPAMNAFERWSIHQAFKDDAEIRTRSVQAPGSKFKYIVIERK